MPLSAEDRLKLRSAYGSLNLPLSPPQAPFHRFSTEPPESIYSTTSALSNHPPWSPGTTTLEPYHKVQIEYPLLNLLSEEETGVVYRPENAANRYQPLPLTQEDDVYVNAGRDRAPEVTFYSIYKACRENGEEDEVPHSGVLTVDVRELTKYVGTTYLMMVIFQTPRRGGLQLRIRAATVFAGKNGQEKKEFQDHEMPLNDFLSLRNGERWYLDALHLIRMSSDRATRHVQFKLYPNAVQGMRGAYEAYSSFRSSFRPPRMPDFELYLENLLGKPDSNSRMLLSIPTKKSRAKGPKCTICENPFEKEREHWMHGPPRIMPCCEKTVAMACVLRSCGKTVARNVLAPFRPVTCPMRKQDLFTDERTLEALKFGVVADTYFVDQRCSEWGNFERSCADLDQRRAELDTSDGFRIDADLFRDVWVKMVEHGSSEDGDGELEHLKIEKSPEFLIWQNGFMRHITKLDSIIPESPRQLYVFLERKIYLEFRRRFQQAGLDRYLPPGARGSWIGKKLPEDMIFREGFLQAVGRLLNRTIRFAQLRKCDRCKGGDPIHWHAGREYYNDTKFGGDTKERAEWKKWQQQEGHEAIDYWYELRGRCCEWVPEIL